MMRVLTLFEVQEYFEDYNAANSPSKITNAQSTGLAYDLTKRMRGQNHFKRGLAAMECIEPRTLLWFGMAALYALSSFHLGKDNGIEGIALLFMIGSAFWIGQSYAYSKTATGLIALCSLTLLASGIYVLETPLTENMYQLIINGILSNPSRVMLIALIAYSAGVLCHALIENPHQSILVISGFTLLSAISFSYIALEASTQNMALWLPAWSLFSLIWIRAYKAPQKRYTLYPC